MQKRMTVPEALAELNEIVTASKVYPDIIVDKQKFVEAVETLNNYHHVIGELVNVLAQKIGE